MPFPELISNRGWAYWLVYPPERRVVPKIKRFREWLIAEIPESARVSQARRPAGMAA
jgi:LysR family glycine cleavage system transcriptional activator